MKKYEELGITTIITNDKLKIEVPIKGLVNAFNLSPNNYDESMKVKRGKRKEFANFVAQYLLDSADADTGDSYVMQMFDRFFEGIFESDFVVDEFIEIKEEDGE
jgi:hypothetical protein